MSAITYACEVGHICTFWILSKDCWCFCRYIRVKGLCSLQSAASCASAIVGEELFCMHRSRLKLLILKGFVKTFRVYERGIVYFHSFIYNNFIWLRIICTNAMAPFLALYTSNLIQTFTQLPSPRRAQRLTVLTLPRYRKSPKEAAIVFMFLIPREKEHKISLAPCDVNIFS